MSNKGHSSDSEEEKKDDKVEEQKEIEEEVIAQVLIPCTSHISQALSSETISSFLEKHNILAKIQE